MPIFSMCVNTHTAIFSTNCASALWHASFSKLCEKEILILRKLLHLLPGMLLLGTLLASRIDACLPDSCRPG